MTSTQEDCQKCKQELTELRQAQTALMGCIDDDEVLILSLEEKVKTLQIVYEDEKEKTEKEAERKDEYIRHLVKDVRADHALYDKVCAELRETKEKFEKLEQEYAQKFAKMEMEMNILEANAVKDHNGIEKLKQELKVAASKDSDEKLEKCFEELEEMEEKLMEMEKEKNEEILSLKNQLAKEKGLRLDLEQKVESLKVKDEEAKDAQIRIQAAALKDAEAENEKLFENLEETEEKLMIMEKEKNEKILSLENQLAMDQPTLAKSLANKDKEIQKLEQQLKDMRSIEDRSTKKYFEEENRRGEQLVEWTKGKNMAESKEKIEKLEEEMEAKDEQIRILMAALQDNDKLKDRRSERLEEIQERDEKIASLENQLAKEKSLKQECTEKLAKIEMEMGENRYKANKEIAHRKSQIQVLEKNIIRHKELNKKDRDGHQEEIKALQEASDDTVFKLKEKLKEAKLTMSDLRVLLEQERQKNMVKEAEPKRSILEGLIMGHHVREDPTTQELDQLKKALKMKDQEIAGLQMELGKLYMKTVELEK